MGRKEIEAERATVAAHLSVLMGTPKFMRDVADLVPLDSDGHLPVVVASAEESAVLAMHRIERMGSAHVILATRFDKKIKIVSMAHSEEESNKATVDIVGGVTVREWFEMMDANPERSYQSTGSDLMPSMRSNEYATA